MALEAVATLGEIMQKLGGLGRRADTPSGPNTPDLAGARPSLPDAPSGTTSPSGATSPSGTTAPSSTTTSPSGTTTPSGATTPETTPSSASPGGTSPGGATTTSGAAPSPAKADPARPSARDQVGDDPKACARPESGRPTCGDPVDVVSGQVLLPQTDVALGGALPLLLTRTHLSGHRAGARFGTSWASTLDQRLEVDDEGVCFVTEDGMVLLYPHPEGTPVLPVEGPRWPLSRTEDGAYAVVDVEGGLTRRFTAGAGGLFPLDSITDLNGNHVTVDHDVDGVPTDVRHSGGYHASVRSTGGLVTALARPDGRESTATCDAGRRPLVMTDVDGAVWRREYDTRGNLLAVTDPSGARTRFDRDERGNAVAITGPLGEVRRIAYDRAGLPVAITDAEGGRTRYRRDRFGRVRKVTDPLGSTTTLGWTIEGRLTSRTLPDGSVERWRYDGEGNPVEHVDAAGGVSRTGYTGFDQPAWHVGPDGARLEFGYDPNLRLTSVVNAQGRAWTYRYGPTGALLVETDFDGRSTTYAHDAAGQLTTKVNGAGERIAYERDELGRLRAKRTPRGDTTYEHDPAGRLVRAVNGDADVVIERDPLGRIVAETVNGRTLRSEHDASGNRVRRVTPTGAVSEWEHDGTGRPTALLAGGRRTAFGYDAAGREVQRVIGDSTRLSQVWDAGHRLLAQSLTARGAHVQRRDYRYRVDGNLLAVDDLLAGPRRYELDQAGRVTSVRGSGWSESYAYDRAGELALATWPGDASGARSYAGTLIRRAGDVHFEHDAQGRVVTRAPRAVRAGAGVAVRLGRRGPPGVRGDPGRRPVGVPLRRARQAGREGTARRGWCGRRPGRLRLGRPGPGRADHRRDRADLGLRARFAPPPHPGRAGAGRAAGVGRRPVPRGGVGRGGDAHRAGRRRRRAGVAVAADPVGRRPGGVRGRPGLPAAVRGPVPRPGNGAVLQRPPLLRPGDRALQLPGPAGPARGPEPARLRREPAAADRPAGAQRLRPGAGDPHQPGRRLPLHRHRRTADLPPGRRRPDHRGTGQQGRPAGDQLRPVRPEGGQRRGRLRRRAVGPWAARHA